MQMPELDFIWRRHFADVQPIANNFRDRFADRWVRFHSLPDSKRYSESQEEMEIVLERHNRVISRVAREDRDLILLSTEHSDSALPTRSALHALCQDEVKWRSLALHELEGDLEEPSYWHVFSSVVRWNSGVLDSLLCLVADDKAANVMLLAKRGWLYHPYDGGADVILPTKVERDLLASEFSSWLSTHSYGL